MKTKVVDYRILFMFPSKSLTAENHTDGILGGRALDISPLQYPSTVWMDQIHKRSTMAKGEACARARADCISDYANLCNVHYDAIKVSNQ